MFLVRYVRRNLVTASTLAGRILKSGLTPQKLSLTICLGVAVALMPVLWGTSLVCALLAALFRLNQAAVQAVNYLCYPLQIVLFIPLCRLGEALFPWGPRVSRDVLTGALHGHLGATLGLIGWASLRGLGAWSITVVPLALASYPFLKAQLVKREARAPGTPASAAPP